MNFLHWARLVRVSGFVAGSLGVALGLPDPANAAVRDPRFAEETVHTGSGMISMEFGPGGRLYVCEKRGRILVLQPNPDGTYAAPATFADLTGVVDPLHESGLLGFALDPAFETNRYLYLLYTTATDQRVVRYRASADWNTLDAGSAHVVLSGLPRMTGIHKAGDLHFSPSEPSALYLTLGDDGDPSRAQNPAYYNGKLLRIAKDTGQGLPSNPFYDSATSVRSRVWAVGLRNPFRFTFHPELPHANVVYLTDNGDSTDRVSRVAMGSNGSWGPGGDGGGFLDPPDAGHRVMTTAPAALTGIAIARGGAFADQDHPGSDVILVANSSGWIDRYRLGGAALDQLLPLAADQGQPFIYDLRSAAGADLTFGPDGALYATTTGGDAADENWYTLLRFRFVAGDPPVADFTTSPEPAVGAAPLTVRFTDASSDPDGTIVSRRWQFGDSGTSTDTNPTHEFGLGEHTVTLTVTDNDGLTARLERTVSAYRQKALTIDARVYDARGSEPAPLGAATELRFYDGRTMSPLPVAASGGNAVAVGTGGAVQTELSVRVTSDLLVVSAGEPEGDGVHAAYRAFSVSEAETQDVELEFWLSDTAIRGRVLDTREQPASVDVGLSSAAPLAPYAVAGGRDTLASSGLAPSGVAHRVVADPGGYYYLPIRSEDGGRFSVDAVLDTGTQEYTRVVVEEEVASQALVELDLTVGRFWGGLQCDDLSGVPSTARVDYERQIQPIWDEACIGCHTASAENSGGLDLTGDSLPRLVDADSAFAPGHKLVRPGDPERSFLMEKISCAAPQIGDRMRPTDAMPLEQQALIRDWIAQLPGGQGTGGSGAGGGATGGNGGIGGTSGGAGGPAQAPRARSDEGGCGCRTAPASQRAWPAGLLGLAVLALRRRSRRR